MSDALPFVSAAGEVLIVGDSVFVGEAFTDCGGDCGDCTGYEPCCIADDPCQTWTVAVSGTSAPAPVTIGSYRVEWEGSLDGGYPLKPYFSTNPCTQIRSIVEFPQIVLRRNIYLDDVLTSSVDFYFEVRLGLNSYKNGIGSPPFGTQHAFFTIDSTYGVNVADGTAVGPVSITGFQSTTAPDDGVCSPITFTNESTDGAFSIAMSGTAVATKDSLSPCPPPPVFKVHKRYLSRWDCTTETWGAAYYAEQCACDLPDGASTEWRTIEGTCLADIWVKGITTCIPGDTPDCAPDFDVIPDPPTFDGAGCCKQYVPLLCCDGASLGPYYIDSTLYDLTPLDDYAVPILVCSIDGVDCPAIFRLGRSFRADELPGDAILVAPLNGVVDETTAYTSCAAARAGLLDDYGSDRAVAGCDGTLHCGGRNCPDGCFEPDKITIAIIGVGFEFCASVPGPSPGSGQSVRYYGPLHGSVTLVRNVFGDYVVSEYHIFYNRAVYASGDETCSGTPTSTDVDFEAAYTGGSDPNPHAAFGYNTDGEPVLTLNLYVGDGGVYSDHAIGKFNLAGKLCLRGPGPNIPIIAQTYGDGTGTAIVVGCPT